MSMNRGRIKGGAPAFLCTPRSQDERQGWVRTQNSFLMLIGWGQEGRSRPHHASCVNARYFAHVWHRASVNQFSLVRAGEGASPSHLSMCGR